MAITFAALAFDPGESVIPDATELHRGRVQWSYNELADTLYVHFFGNARPAVSVPVETGDHDILYLRVDETDRRVTGLQIEDASTFARGPLPALREVMDAGKADPASQEAAMARLLDDVRRLVAESAPPPGLATA